MSKLILHRDGVANALPEPRCGPVTVREATLDDLPFIDELQKKHSKMVGWFPTKQIEANITGGHVLIAEEGTPALRAGSETPGSESRGTTPLGYVIARDTYMKREDCGIVYQLNVSPGEHRKLVGASLIKAVFDRAAYGCRLFCCWCAQDIDANHFWESIGFVPLAFRTGSRVARLSEPGVKKPGSESRGTKKGPRIHIFWQRRIRAGDAETPYWFPSQTTGGAVREGRIVLPIPPGTHWSDAKPAVLPGLPANKAAEQWQLESDREKKSRPRKKVEPVQVQSRNSIAAGGLRFGSTPGGPQSPQEKAAKKAKEQKPKVKYKNDPQYIAAARELRDRYIEQINAGLLLPPSACGKYDVSRALEAAPSAMKARPDQVRVLDAA